MRFHVAIVAVLLAVVVCIFVWTNGTPKQVRYVSAENGFAVSFPADPSPKIEHKEGVDGIQSVITGVLTPEAGYTVTLSRLPPGIHDTMKGSPPDALLEALALSAADSIGGRVVSANTLTFGQKKLRAREYLLDKGKAFFRGRTIVAGNNVYSVVVGGKEAFVTGKYGTDYLDSFELVK